MSELKVDKVSPRTGTYVSLNTVGSKNILINGDMSIAQRGTSASGLTSGGYLTVDRFNFGIASAGTWTITQDTDVPSGQGFAKSTKLDCTTANASLGSSAELTFYQKIEGQNLQYLKKGTANAESVTFSFWVKSSKTGTYTAEIYDADNDRQISKTYTIDSASTWEKKTITFAGDTTGTLDNDNAVSFWIFFWLGAGSNYTSGTLNTSWNSATTANRVSSSQVNLADSTSNDWFVTGVQLEAGTTSSDFEFLPYDMNLLRCQRYYQYVAAGSSYPRGSLDAVITNAVSYTTTLAYGVFNFPTTMRSGPSVEHTTGSNYYRYYNAAISNDYFDGFVSYENTNENILIGNSDTMGLTAGQAGWMTCVNANAYVAFDAEL